MKRWFSFQRGKKPDPIVPPPRTSVANHSPVPTVKATTIVKKWAKSTQAKLLPNEIWYELTILATESGLLIQPVLSEAAMHLRISWGKDGEVAQVKTTKEDGYDWSTGITVYGLVGILSLFSSTLAP